MERSEDLLKFPINWPCWFNRKRYCYFRFLNPAMANKNRIQPPSKIVHFFNTPPDLTEETVHRVFVERGIEAPTTVKLFPLKSERSSSGLIEFSSVGIAVAAIMECNHTALENSSEYFSAKSPLRKIIYNFNFFPSDLLPLIISQRISSSNLINFFRREFIHTNKFYSIRFVK